MSVYKCEVCGMSIGTMTCGTCDKELAHARYRYPNALTVTV